MTQETKRIMLNVEDSILDGNGDLADLEGAVVEIPAGASSWQVVRGSSKYIFTPSGIISNGVEVFRPTDRRSR